MGSLHLKENLIHSWNSRDTHREELTRLLQACYKVHSTHWCSDGKGHLEYSQGESGHTLIGAFTRQKKKYPE